MRGEFDSLSALDEGEGKAANEAMLSARLTEDSKLLQRILQAEGWYDAAVQTRIDRAPREPMASRSPRCCRSRRASATRSARSRCTADPTVPPELIANNLALKVGEPIVAERIQGAEANVAIVLPQKGYPFASVGQRDVLLDPDTHLGDYTLPVTSGPRARFGGFRTTGDLAFDGEHVEGAGAVQARRTVRQPQGRRSAPGAGRDRAVLHRRGRAGAQRPAPIPTAPNT